MSNKTDDQNKPTLSDDALRRRLLAHSLMRPDRLPSIGRELAFAIADLRQKVLEEGVYGRPVTPENIHGRRDEAAGDPLGRSAVEHFRERCRMIHESREQFAPERAGPDLDR